MDDNMLNFYNLLLYKLLNIVEKINWRMFLKYVIVQC